MSGFRNILPWIGGLLVAALIGHYVTLAALPHYGTAKTFANINKKGALVPNKLLSSGLRYHGTDVVPRDNPDTTTSFAKYDLSKGPVRFTGAIPTDGVYWSMSLYAYNTDNFFVLNDRDAKSRSPKVVIVRKGRPYTPAPDELVAHSPSTTGALIVRLIVPDRNDKPTVDALTAELRKATLEPVQ